MDGLAFWSAALLLGSGKDVGNIICNLATVMTSGDQKTEMKICGYS